ncbi:MAG: DUF2716 domain-containing protein [Myxococcota bacterium]|nr:DUF2716 domain-containing protein [Myxococcota bacterium]
MLTDTEERAVWERFRREFAFRPSVRAEDWPGIREPAPSITYAIPERYNEDDLENLDRHVLRAFRACTGPEERLYALDWQHACFWLRPHAKLPDDGTRVWSIPVLPTGDYAIFLAESFRFGIFGHPWERTWCVFGAELLAAFEDETPRLFSSVMRQSGAGPAP